MHGWLGMAMIPIGIGMAVAAFMKHRSRMSNASSAGQMRPEFAAMGEIMRPIVLFVVGIFAAEMILLYFVFGGRQFMTALDFGGIMFVLATYTGYLLVATRKQVQAPETEATGSEVQTAA
jgi:acyl-CoA synthetase (AMP-forming)/AMP-acid ligase II